MKVVKPRFIGADSLEIVGLTPGGKEVRKIVLRTLVGERREEFKEDLQKIRTR